MIAAPQPPPNPARIADELFNRLSTIPGWTEFVKGLGELAHYASTPGWQDCDGKATHKGAKPIGLAQWGAAMTSAGLITEAVRGAPWPTPGIDPAGFIWLTWRISDNAQLALELHADSREQTYKWQSMRDGMPANYTSRSLGDVVMALRSVMVGSARL